MTITMARQAARMAPAASANPPAWAAAPPGAGSGQLPARRIADPLLSARALSVDYGLGTAAVRAVTGASFTVHRGEVFGLAGDAGSGKSTLARAVTGTLPPPGVIAGGQVVFHPEPARTGVRWLALATPAGQDRHRAVAPHRDLLTVDMHDAIRAVDPTLTIEGQLSSVLRQHRPWWCQAERRARARQLLEQAEVPLCRLGGRPRDLPGRLPQRLVIAIALARDPHVLLIDEPANAAEAIEQRELLCELMRARDRLRLAVLLVSRDRSMVAEFADTIAVMRDGRITELTRAARVRV